MAEEQKDVARQQSYIAAPAEERMVDEALKNDVAAPNLLCPSPGLGCLWCMGIPFGGPLCSFMTVNVKQEHVILSCGKYFATLRDPGCYVVNQCCAEVRTISTAQVATNLENVKVADGKGNPLMLSGVVTYKVVNSGKAALAVENYKAFIRTQGLTVMKKVAAMYPYEAKKGEHSLKSEADELRVIMIDLLQKRVNEAGVLILNFEFNDLAYAPEIAQAMLVRQQAEAVVDARKLIAEGAVEIVKETLAGLAEQGISMDDQDKMRMASNLVVAICSESGAAPVMNVNA